MSGADLAAVLVAVAAFAAFVVVLLAVQSLLRSLRELRRSLEILERETVPLLEELRSTVADAGAEVERVDQLLDAAETISATVDSASRLSYLAFRAPLIRLVAFFKGVGRFVSRLFGRGGRDRRSARRARRRSRIRPGDTRSEQRAA